jgi:AAA family ATP:ADP antiporter
MLKRLLRPIVEVRDEEVVIAVLMFSYSFLAMTVWNILKPITRSKFISDLGADNLPYVTLVAGVAIGFIMQGYSKAIARVPRRWAIPVTQAGLIAILVFFWVAFRAKAAWAPPAFYFFGLIFSVLLISQFWTLANDIFDARQAKRIFGFIGGGSSLGGIMGSTLLQFAQRLGTNNLLLVSASLLTVCLALVVYILRTRRDVDLAGVTSTGEEAGLGGGEAFRLLRSSKHLQVISLVISFAAIGAYVIEQQLNMAVEEHVEARADTAAARAVAAVQASGGDATAQEQAAADARKHTTDDITQLLGRVQLYTSLLGFVIQVWLVSKIQRYLGVGFALLLLPVSMGLSASLILVTGMLWSTQVARVLDTGLRYTVDKTTREILFLPLPTDLKYQAKPFVDVTMDRFAKGIGGVLTLLLIKPWGLNLGWRQLSVASLTLVALWVVVAVVARRSYLRAIPEMFGGQALRPAEVRIGGDRETIERVLMEMADPDERRVLYAIDVLESLEKKNLVTPLLLYHESPKVRARALAAMAETRSEVVQRWQPKVEGMLSDPDTQVRVAALRALAAMKHATAADLVRPYLDDRDPRIASAAALVLARSVSEDDKRRAENTLARLSADTSEAGAAVRRDVAVAVRQVPDERYRHLLVPLLYDADRSVAAEALASVKQIGTADFLFVPALVQLLRHRWLKSEAREVLVSYGAEVVEALSYFLRDPDEDVWVRRHIPATLARIPSQASMDALSGALAGERDGFLRYKLITAMDRLVRDHPELTFDRKPVEAIALREGTRYYQCLSLHHNLFEREGLDPDHLLARALREKMARARSRVFLLLGLLHSPREVSAAKWAIERGDVKARAGGLEYLDNVLGGPVRKRLLPMFEDMPSGERVRQANALLNTRVRNTEETLLELINDDDQIVAASAIHLAAQTQMWSLADDIEYVLEHRDARDWYVFEAASWALAEHRMPAERRRALWLEPLPAVEFASRLSALPLFGRTSVDELFRLAGASQQVRHEPGKVLYAEGSMPTAVQFLLDGSVTVADRTGDTRTATPPAPLAFDEAVQGLPMTYTVRTNENSVTLSLTVEEYRTLLANNTDLVQGLFGTILDHPAFASRRLVVRGEGGADLARLAADGVSPVERVLALQRIDLFLRFPAEELLQLANTARAVSFKAGDRLFAEADTAAIHIVIDGVVSLEGEGQEALRTDAGDAIGIYETLAGVAVGRQGIALTNGALLRIDHDDLFDAVGQRPDLMRNLFTALLGTRLQVQAEAA